MYLILVPVLERGEQISFTPDTRYLTWTTTFPAVTVCESYNFKMAQKKLISLYPDLMGSLDYDFKKHLTELVFGRGTCNKKLCVPCGSVLPCDLPWRDIIDNVHKKCSELIVDCRYNGKQFPCCKKFREVDSEYGYCYSFNTLQSKNAIDEPLYDVNLTTGPGLLTFSVLNDAHISVHSPEDLATDVLDYKFRFNVKPGSVKWMEFLFSIVEVENDPVLQLEPTDVRGCRYLDEVPKDPFHKYRVYSYGACHLAEQTHHVFEHCGCVHPARHPIYQKLFCNFTGLNCLVTHEVQILKAGSEKHEEEIEECMPSCVESELTTIHISKLPRNRDEDSAMETSVQVRMSSLPTLRYKRNLIRTDLDFVVSIGGIVGLFFGASVLSVAEISYLVLRTK